MTFRGSTSRGSFAILHRGFDQQSHPTVPRDGVAQRAPRFDVPGDRVPEVLEEFLEIRGLGHATGQVLDLCDVRARFVDLDLDRERHGFTMWPARNKPWDTNSATGASSFRDAGIAVSLLSPVGSFTPAAEDGRSRRSPSYEGSPRLDLATGFARSLRTVLAARVRTPMSAWYSHVVGSARSVRRRNIT